MSLYFQRLHEVGSFFDNRDTVLGYRKLMDCVMDTQDMSLYREMIFLTDWKEQHPNDEQGLIDRSKDMLAKLQQVEVTEAEVHQPVIAAEDIIKNYRSSGFQLGPMSLDIKKRSVYGLVGENGNGKTTLLRMLAKELEISQGNINFHFDAQVTSDFDLRSKLVYIPQRTATWYGSLKDNLKFVLSNYNLPPKENETRVLMMIARLGLWNYKHLKWSELSSGYKMRFELARTLLRRPEVMLLDEPLANLDVLAQQVVLEDLTSICNSVSNPIALILSSQQLYEVEKVSDKVIYLKNGKYTDNNATFETVAKGQLIVEIDSTASREALQEAFKALPVEKLVFNGGVFLCYFAPGTPFHEIMQALGSHQIDVTYLRNISSSTRRFFVS
ncbi:ABC transporter ATP-binding protein [Nonlabens xiamenensis]|uniref:ABC transporter ATP-binding protein n=1 Tax=Nonlabens xiamenensis TaxID=2341043 RepID=UPI000F615C40|nr:ABC transporter ATP-binding protein [Nonlabens xiamenensis]